MTQTTLTPDLVAVFEAADAMIKTDGFRWVEFSQEKESDARLAVQRLLDESRTSVLFAFNEHNRFNVGFEVNVLEQAAAQRPDSNLGRVATVVLRQTADQSYGGASMEA